MILSELAEGGAGNHGDARFAKKERGEADRVVTVRNGDPEVETGRRFLRLPIDLPQTFDGDGDPRAEEVGRFAEVPLIEGEGPPYRFADGAGRR